MPSSARQRPDGRVALSISGAASLGAFEGGAVAAIVTGLQPLCAGDEPDLRVEVVTGASSGAVTGLLAAHCLTGGTDAVATLHEAWVERASLAELRGGGLRAPLSLDRVRRAAIDLLTGGGPGDPGRRQRGPVHVELALTSLRGAGWSSHLAWSRFDLAPGMDRRELADAVESALASAASTLAFAPWLVRPLGTGADSPPGFYADGALVAGEPIGRAGELAAADDTHPWLVVAVHPYLTRRSPGPAWADPEVPPTWAATVRRGREIRRREVLARDLRSEGDEVALVSPDLLAGDRDPTAPANLAGLAFRERRRRDFDQGYRCGLRWLQSADLTERLGVSDHSVSTARDAAAAAYELVSSDGPTSGAVRRREVVDVARVGARVAAVAVHDAVLAHRRAQDTAAPGAAPGPADFTGDTGTPRWFHRDGVVFEATLRLETVVPAVLTAFADHGEEPRRALVRLSRFWPAGAGARFVGVAVRLLDEPRFDLLLLSAGETPLGRRVFHPTDTPLLDAFYSSVTVFTVGGERLLFGARPEAGARAASLEELLALDEPAVTLRLEVARRTGPWFSLGLLEIGRRRPDLDVRFRPSPTGGRVRAGVFGPVRDRIYRASRTGRWPWIREVLHADRPPPGGAGR